MSALWSLTKGWRLYGWLMAVLTLLTAGSMAYVGNAKASAYAKGRADVLNATRFDSVLVSMVVKQRAAAVARTDTVVDTVTVRVATVRTVIKRVPDTVRVAFPVVDTLVVESERLAATVDTLVDRIDVERAVAKMSESVLVAQVTAARIETVKERDMRVQAEKRPSWLVVAGVGVAAGLLGLVVGVTR